MKTVKLHILRQIQFLRHENAAASTSFHVIKMNITSYIPQTEQHEPEGQMLFRLGNVTDLLDVTPNNPIPHPLSPPPISLCVI